MEDTPKFASNNDDDSVDVDLSNEVVNNLLRNLTSRAMKGDSSLKYAASSLPGPKASPPPPPPSPPPPATTGSNTTSQGIDILHKVIRSM
ncbi:cysteine-rich receptor-like protein kinase [Trifolium pratense]|uniref:Cysteine-rich receptor-like protein kinase n=1 Tax=Trifolium pratense TaxID=57577 RepID=A0A2K3MTT7_TRIPR|nr:cysteine-rich receptor-like protein kinase [Trifolium pratense]